MTEIQGLDERGRWRCSLAARERGDQRVGTAVPATRWLLVGHPGPWARGALLTPPVLSMRHELDQALRDSGVRLQLIRRHGGGQRVEAPAGGSITPRPPTTAPPPTTAARRDARPPHDLVQPVFLVDIAAGRVGRATWSDPADLLDLLGQFDDLPPEPADPLVLVCAHGRRDQCCAIEGRQVAAVLDGRLPGAVWETTHLGGDRFAANVACLPEGSMYGGLDAETAPSVIGEHLAGQVDLGHWRGRAGWSPAAQVAVADLVADGLPLAAVRWPRAEPVGPDRWRVQVETESGPFARVVERVVGPPRRLTCEDASSRAATYRLVLDSGPETPA